MKLEFESRLAARLVDYAAWADGHNFALGRLVHYCGVGSPNAADISAERIAEEIEGCLREGFTVNWAALGKRVFIAVQEPGCPIPPWEKVFAEEAIEDVDAILRSAGLRPFQN